MAKLKKENEELTEKVNQLNSSSSNSAGDSEGYKKKVEEMSRQVNEQKANG